MKKKYTFILFLFGLLLFACQSNVQTKDSEQTETIVKKTPAIFIANPQSVAEQTVTTLKIGQSAPDFKLPGIDNKFHTLKEYDADILVILFSCNHCPTAHLTVLRGYY